MKTKNFIYGIIFIGWAIILGSYFTDSEIYQDVALWIFVIFGVIGTGITLYGIFRAIKNMFN